MEERIRKRLLLAVRDQVFPGAVVGVIKNEKSLIILEGGHTYDGNSHKVTSQTLYDVASITKSVPTSSLALQLIDAKKISLDDKVVQYLPRFKHGKVTIWHLLTQTVSFRTEEGPLRLAKLRGKRPDEIMDSIYSADISVPPKSSYSYSNATSIVLGQVIEILEGKALDILAYEKFFSPLEMTSTTFHPLENVHVTPTEIDPMRGGVVQGVVHDESAYALGRKMVVGSAGLFSTAPDLLRFIQMVLNKGSINGKMYFSEEIIEQMFSNQLEGGDGAGLGWELNQPQYMGRSSNEHMIGKTGFTGCVVMMDLNKKTGLVILSNSTFPKRKPDGMMINQLRRDIADSVFGE